MYKHMMLDGGNIGMIALPLTISQLYNDKEKTIRYCVEAAKLAHEAGAEVVSLTGLLPSATQIGADIKEAVNNAGIVIKVTTGHATTTATIILSINRILNESNRVLENEDVCVLGVGSIGSATVKLMLSVLPPPRTLTLCDLPSKMNNMLKLKTELKTKFNYTGDVRLAYTDRARIPDEVYKATLIIGATNSANSLKADYLKTGTLIVDDSGPHCISPESIIDRFLSKKDVLMTEGGVLEIPGTIINTLSFPKEIDTNIFTHYKSHFVSEKELTGCILSGLLSFMDDKIKPTIGQVETIDSITNYNYLIKLKYKGAKLHFENFILPTDLIHAFTHKSKRDADNSIEIYVGRNE